MSTTTVLKKPAPRYGKTSPKGKYVNDKRSKEDFIARVKFVSPVVDECVKAIVSKGAFIPEGERRDEYIHFVLKQVRYQLEKTGFECSERRRTVSCEYASK